jgi:hypothetical protein
VRWIRLKVVSFDRSLSKGEAKDEKGNIAGVIFCHLINKDN